MNTAFKKPVTPSGAYRVVCERCKKLIFFSGQDNPETYMVLCDECTQISNYIL